MMHFGHANALRQVRLVLSGVKCFYTMLLTHRKLGKSDGGLFDCWRALRQRNREEQRPYCHERRGEVMHQPCDPF